MENKIMDKNKKNKWKIRLWTRKGKVNGIICQCLIRCNLIICFFGFVLLIGVTSKADMCAP